MSGETTTESLSQRFQRFARKECQGSPLYYRLALGIATDPVLLALAAYGEHGPKPNLFLAAVHFLLLKDPSQPLSVFYPTISGRPIPDDDPYPVFRSFCLAHTDEIRSLMETRLVQTNEVGRGAILFPAFSYLSDQASTPPPYALIEVGVSAGLLLGWDRYSYYYDGEGPYGDSDSAVRIDCQIRGDQPPPLTLTLPTITSRIGIDLNPVDIRDPDESLWLRALVWGDQPERAQRLNAAIKVATQLDLKLIEGDALVSLESVLAATPEHALPVVYHCHTLNQFTPQARQQFEDILLAHSTHRPIVRFSLEASRGMAYPDLTLHRYQGRKVEEKLLAYYEPHGRWIEWLDAP